MQEWESCPEGRQRSPGGQLCPASRWSLPCVGTIPASHETGHVWGDVPGSKFYNNEFIHLYV